MHFPLITDGFYNREISEPSKRPLDLWSHAKAGTQEAEGSRKASPQTSFRLIRPRLKYSIINFQFSILNLINELHYSYA